jgi:hypothetical protein
MNVPKLKCLLATAIVACLSGCANDAEERALVATWTAITQLEMSIADAVLHRDAVLEFPASGVENLYAWFDSPERRRSLGYVEQHALDADRRVFRDRWGRALVYRFPAADKDRIYDLYSVGPNGIDEGGGGDDIRGSLLDTYQHYRARLSDGRVNREWLLENYGRLRYDWFGRLVVDP